MSVAVSKPVVNVHKWLQEQNLPLVERVEIDGERWYRFPNDPNPANYFASVTNILSVAQPKPLTEYFKRTSYRKQTERLDEAAGLGSYIHDLINRDLQGETIPETDLHYDYRIGDNIIETYPLTDWFKRWQKLKIEKQITADALEIPVVNTALGYAGTCDLLGSYMGQRAIMDVKSGRYGKHAGHQMIAYKKAYQQMIGGDFPSKEQVEKGDLRLVGLSLPWNRNMNTFMYEHEDFVWTSFRAAFHLWKDFNFTRLKKIGWKYLDVKMF